jgi:nitroreductase
MTASKTSRSTSPSLAQISDAASVFNAVLHDRFSCRGYLSKSVPREIIEQILSTAQLTASWCNSQPWHVVVTEGEGTQRFGRALFAHAQKTPPPKPDFPFPERYVGIYKERQRECGWQLYEAVGVAYGDRSASQRQSLENFRFFGAPHVAIISSERDLGVYGVLDCGGYVSNFLLAAKTRGVASIAQAALAVYSDFVHDYFGIPDHRMIVCGISFGYPDPNHPANSFRTSRAHLSEAVRWVGD